MGKLLADDLFNGKNFLKYRKKIIQEVIEQSKKIDSVKPPLKERVDLYDNLLKEGAEYKGGDFWYPYIGSGLGNGAYVELADGSVKIDLISGIGVHYLGHSSHGVIAHALESAITNTIHNGHLQQNVDSIKLMDSILRLANIKLKNGERKLKHCFISTSGAMANENALKIAFHKKPGSDRILCFEKCFSGRTIATCNMTDKAANRVGIPNVLNVDYVPFYSKENSTQTLDCIKKYVDRYPDKHAAMCLELVQGEGGYNSGDVKFFNDIADYLKTKNIAFWVDEIQTFGRTYEPFAYQFYGLDKKVDIVTMGKAAQVCATLFTEDYKPKSGLLSQTFTSPSSAIKASQYIMDYILKNYDNIFSRYGEIDRIRGSFSRHFKVLEKKYGSDIINGCYGVGGMIATEVFGGDLQKSVDFTKKLFDNGVISFIAGKNPTRIRFLPPVNIKDDVIDEAMFIFGKTIEEFI